MSNHTSFTVADLDMIIPFFRAVLGFGLTSRGPRDGAVMSRMTGIVGVDVTITHLRGSGHNHRADPIRAPDRSRSGDPANVRDGS